MLKIHKALVVFHCASPDWVIDQGENLAHDRFYHRLMPSLWDALGLMMAKFPERDQAGTSFDTLYMLAKKMEAWDPSCPHRGGSGSSDSHGDKYRRYPAPMGWVAILGEEELLLPDPLSPDSETHKLEVIEGLGLRMTQPMNHYQREECCCFMCRATDHFVRDCPHQETFHAWHREYLNSKGVGPPQKVSAPKRPPQR